MNHFAIDKALNLSPENIAEENWAEVRPLWEDLPESHDKRHALNKAIGSQTMEFRHHNVEFGYTYDSTAIVHDGSPEYVPLDPVRLYEPSTKPGHPMPHAFVEREGERIPLGTLVHGGHFLLIAGEDGGDWVEAAEQDRRGTQPADQGRDRGRPGQRLRRRPRLLAQAPRDLSDRCGAGPAGPVHCVPFRRRRRRRPGRSQVRTQPGAGHRTDVTFRP